MRIIKFRGRSKVSNEWYYGSLEKIKAQNQTEYYIIDELENSQFIEPRTVGQFTGLLDIEGKEIYEGDILTSKYEHPTFDVVFWDTDELAFALNNSGAVVGLSSVMVKEYKLRVIGNIYDNPELIDNTPES
jgi:uncharacterized phage protein (TIGR01671 family)